MLLSFNVEKQIITRTDTERVVTNSMNYLYAQFSFSDEWTGEKTAVFKGKHGTYNALLDADNKCLVPWEILTEAMFDVSVFCGDLITANKVKIFTTPSGYEIGDESRIPTPEIYTQVINRLNEIEAEVDPEAIERTVDEYLADKDIVTEEDVETIVSRYISDIHSIPMGGTVGQFLTKKSNSDYDTEWSDAPSPSSGKKAVIIGDSYFDKGNDYNFADYLRSKNIYDEVVDYAEGGSGFGKTTTGHQTLYEKLQDSQMRADIANADVIYMHLGGNDIITAMPNYPNAVAESDIYLRVQESLAEIYAINSDVTVYYIPSMDYKAIQVLFICAANANEKPTFLPSKISRFNALQALLIHYMIHIGIINSALKIYCLDTPSCYLVEQLASDNMHPTPWAASGMFEAFIRGNYNNTNLKMFIPIDQTSSTIISIISGISVTFIQNYVTIFSSLIANRKVSKSLTWIVAPNIVNVSSDLIYFFDVPALMYGGNIYSSIVPYGNDKVALMYMESGLSDATITNASINLSPLNETNLPTTDGTYKLKVEHVSGKVQYSWVAG